MKNKRLMLIAEMAYRMNLGVGEYPLDGYNQKVITDGICYTVTTRTFGDNNHFLMEIDETEDTAGHEEGIHRD